MFEKLIAFRQKNSSSRHQVLANTTWLFADQILRMGVAFFISVWVARYLQPEQFGLYNYALTFVALFSPIAKMGLDEIVVRDCVGNPSGKDEILGTTFTLKLISGIFTLALTVGVIGLVHPSDTLTQWLVGITAAGTIFQAFETIDFWFQSQLQSKYTVWAKNGAFWLLTIAKIVFIQIKAPLIAFACAALVEIMLNAVGWIIIYQALGNSLRRWHSSIQYANKLLKDSWPLIFSGVTILIYAKIDQFMLGSLLTDKSELGFYSVAVKLSEVFDFLPVAMYMSILPKLTEIKVNSYEQYVKRFQNYFDLMLVLWLVIAIPISLGSSLIVNLYGEAYAPSATILSIYVWAQFGTNFGVARSAFIIIEGKQKLALFLSILGAGINILLNLYSIPKFGAMGATVSTLITYFVVTVFLNFVIPDLKFISKLIMNSCNLYKVALRMRELIR